MVGEGLFKEQCEFVGVWFRRDPSRRLAVCGGLVVRSWFVKLNCFNVAVSQILAEVVTLGQS